MPQSLDFFVNVFTCMFGFSGMCVCMPVEDRSQCWVNSILTLQPYDFETKHS